MTWLERVDEWTGHRLYTLCLINAYLDCKQNGDGPTWRLEGDMVCLANPIGFAFYLPNHTFGAASCNTFNITIP